jgi:hypothetical protein
MEKAPKAKRLNLILTPEVVRPTLSTDVVCIRLTSGVEIDFPKGGLGVEFLEMLSSVRGGP